MFNNMGGCALSNEKEVKVVKGSAGNHEYEAESSSPLSSLPAKEQPSGFDAIVETGYRRALKSVQSKERQPFDIDWWERKSGLTTTGGLGHLDRIKLGEIYRHATSLFEYGLGESTYIANHVGVPRYAGIDSDPVWVGMARDKVAEYFRFYLGDIGKTKAWGFPTEPNQQKNILDYQLAPLIVEPLPFDVYMIDGRWRLPTMIACFLHASDRGAPHNQTVGLIHDCLPKGKSFGDRPEYKRADHLLELVDHSGEKLCVYQRKPSTTDADLKDLWHQYMDQLSRR